MTDAVKRLLDVCAPDGGYIYTVGSFGDRESAERLAELLGAVDGVTAKVLELKN